jgi:hypothetical protein
MVVVVKVVVKINKIREYFNLSHTGHPLRCQVYKDKEAVSDLNYETTQRET